MARASPRSCANCTNGLSGAAKMSSPRASPAARVSAIASAACCSIRAATSIDPRAELGLMFSDRAQAIAEVIRPALDRGAIVLCDRYTDSTEAYQGAGRELGSARVLALHRELCGLDPDLTLLLLPDFDASLARARQRNETAAAITGKDENRFESLDTAFFRRVYNQYRAIAQREPSRVVAIEGDAGVEAVHRRILSIMEERLTQHRAS